MADLNDISPYAEGAFLTGLLADWGQTREAARGGYTEHNKILGPHPSQGKVNAYMPIAGAAQYAGYKALPDDYKLPYALASALIEGSVVNQNRQLGEKINPGALGLGALLTYLLVKNHSNSDKKEPGLLDMDIRQVDHTTVPTVTMKW